jgi:alpha-tubulin suppressor-like RCC1 family protein
LNDTDNKYEPTNLSFFNDLHVKDFICGSDHTIVILGKIYSKKNNIIENGKVYGFGSNTSGQLGLDELKIFPSPVELEFCKEYSIKKIICGSHHTFLILSKKLT